MPALSLVRRRSPVRAGKALPVLLGALALAFLACCGSAVFISMRSKKEQEAALAEAFLPMLQQMMEHNFSAIRPFLETAAAAAPA